MKDLTCTLKQIWTNNGTIALKCNPVNALGTKSEAEDVFVTRLASYQLSSLMYNPPNLYPTPDTIST